MDSVPRSGAAAFANQLLGSALFRPPVCAEATLTRTLDTRPTPADWVAEWLRLRLPILTERDRKRLVLAVVGKRDIGRTLVGWEQDIARAWDDAMRQERAQSGAEGGGE